MPIVTLSLQKHNCTFTSKASTPDQQLQRPCAATRSPAAGHLMVRCGGCNRGRGAWFCVGCLTKFKKAIVEHGGEDGDEYRNLHRIASVGIDALLAVDWSSILSTGTLETSALPDGMQYDPTLGTLVFSSECAVCWRKRLMPSTRVDTNYRDMKPVVLNRERVDLGQIEFVCTISGERVLMPTIVWVLVMKALITDEHASKFKWELCSHEKHGDFLHEHVQPEALENTNTWVVQMIEDDDGTRSCLSAILRGALLQGFKRRFGAHEHPPTATDTARLLRITRGASSLRRGAGRKQPRNVVCHSLLTSQRRVSRVDGPFGQAVGDSEEWKAHVHTQLQEGTSPRTGAAAIIVPYGVDREGGCVALREFYAGVRAKHNARKAAYPFVAMPPLGAVPRAGWVAPGDGIVSILDEVVEACTEQQHFNRKQQQQSSSNDEQCTLDMHEMVEVMTTMKEEESIHSLREAILSRLKLTKQGALRVQATLDVFTCTTTSAAYMLRALAQQCPHLDANHSMDAAHNAIEVYEIMAGHRAPPGEGVSPSLTTLPL